MYSAVPATSLAYTAKISTLSYQIPIAKLKPPFPSLRGCCFSANAMRYEWPRGYETYYGLVETLFISDTKD